MPKEVLLPKMGQSMEDGTLVAVNVKIGDEVKTGDVIFEIETDKATLEMESPSDGFVKALLVKLGQTVEVGTAIAVLGEENETVSQKYLESLLVGANTLDSIPDEDKSAGVIDFTNISDKALLAALKESPSNGTAPKYAFGQTVPLTKKQKLIGQRSVLSKQTIPCFYLTTKVDVTDLIKMRGKLNRGADVKISFNDFVIRAIALSLKDFPVMTGQIVGDAIKAADCIGVGLAIAVDDGVVAPTVKKPDVKSAREVAAYNRALVERAKANSLLPDDFDDCCITLTNLGAYGVDSCIPVVVPGQCSIIGIGRIVDTCTPSSGSILLRQIMSMTISVDHKVANGADAAQFLDHIKKALENPSVLV